jgi:hypothetical protein
MENLKVPATQNPIQLGLTQIKLAPKDKELKLGLHQAQHTKLTWDLENHPREHKRWAQDMHSLFN